MIGETQEWTPEHLANAFELPKWLQSVCDAHNAALSAANNQLDDAGSHNAAADRELRELRQQLAAEREQHKKDIGALIESHAAKVLSKVKK